MRAECELKATRLIVALHAFDRAEGGLPEALDALVPEYLDRVPRDPYDGASFRYDRSLEVVYSVGENLEDHGGRDVLRMLEDEDWEDWMRHRDADDYVFPIGVRDPRFRE